MDAMGEDTRDFVTALGDYRSACRDLRKQYLSDIRGLEIFSSLSSSKRLWFSDDRRSSSVSTARQSAALSRTHTVSSRYQVTPEQASAVFAELEVTVPYFHTTAEADTLLVERNEPHTYLVRPGSRGTSLTVCVIASSGVLKKFSVSILLMQNTTKFMIGDKVFDSIPELVEAFYSQRIGDQVAYLKIPQLNM